MYRILHVQYVLVGIFVFVNNFKRLYNNQSIYIYREQSLNIPKHMFTVFCTQSSYSYTVIPLYTRARELNKYYCPIHTITIYMYIVCINNKKSVRVRMKTSCLFVHPSFASCISTTDYPEHR